MSERERWIIYPLLFLALGTAMRGKLGFTEDEVKTEKVTFKNVVCDNIEVKEKGIVEGTLISNHNITQDRINNLRVNGSIIGNELVIVDNENHPVLLLTKDKNSKSGEIISFNSESQKLFSVPFIEKQIQEKSSQEDDKQTNEFQEKNPKKDTEEK